MTDRKNLFCTATCVALLATICSSEAKAQDGADAAADDDEARVAQACLDNPTIRRTQILNDRNIAFITRGGLIYNNQLPKQCPSLRPGSLVSYAITYRKVCAGSQIQVLWKTGAEGSLTPVFTCELGAFVPITEAELDDLTTMLEPDREQRRARRRSARPAVTSQEVELPPPAAEEQAQPPAAPAE